MAVQTETRAASIQKKSAKSFRRRYVLFGALAAILVVLLWGGFTALNVRRKVESGNAHLQTVLAMVRDGGKELTTPDSLNVIRAELNAASTDFGDARGAVWPLRRFLAPAAILPAVPGYDIAHLYDLLLLAETGTRAAATTVDAVSPAAAAMNQTSTDTTSGSGLTISGGDKLLRVGNALAANANAFGTARSQINEMLAIRGRLNKDSLKLDQAKKALDQLDGITPALSTGLDLAQSLPPVLPSLLAQGGKKQYLVVAQNSDELRPTGGFLSTVGLLAVADGRIALTDFRDSYAVDNSAFSPTAPPAPLTTYMYAGGFVVRDANFWPDFPTSARTIAALYQANQNIKADGVIAVDLRAVGYILEALGPVDVPDYGETVDATNYQERIRFHYLKPSDKVGIEWWKQRKDFIGGLFRAIVARVNVAGGKDYLKLADALTKSIAQKHIQSNFADTTLQQTLATHAIDGGLSPSATGDYLNVVDSNLGFNKVNARINRSIDYSVRPSPDGLRAVAKVTVRYVSTAGVREGEKAGACVAAYADYNDSYDKMMAGCYYNYLRVYVPSGSLLAGSAGFAAGSVEGYDELDKRVFAGYVVVPPGATAEVSFEYSLAGSAWPFDKGEAYTLRVQKEAGTLADPLSITVRLPHSDQDRTWKTDLLIDREFSIEAAR